MQEGFSYADAPMAMAAWVTDSPNVHTGRRLPLRYRFHVAMAGSLGIGGDLTRCGPGLSSQKLGASASLPIRRSGRPCNTGRSYRLARRTRTGALGAVEYIARDEIDGRRCAGMDRCAAISAYTSGPPGTACGPRAWRPLPGHRDWPVLPRCRAGRDRGQLSPTRPTSQACCCT